MFRLICGTRMQITINLLNKRFVHRMIFDMEHMYFRQEESSETFNISFRYVNDKYGVDREFNFCRNVTENVADCASRMSTNLEKAFNKKMKKKRKTAEPEIQFPEIEVKFYKNDEMLSSQNTCKDVIQNYECITVHVIDKTYKIILNPPWINTLQLPTSMLAGFPTYPSKLEMQFLTLDQCKLEWFKGKYDPSKQKAELVDWINIGEGYIVNTTNSDIGFKLKVICEANNNGLVGPKAECISANEIEAGPGHCPFETRHLYTKKRLSGNSFRVCSYNILADLYCDSDFTRTVLHPYCPPYALQIDYRKQLFLKEILGYNFDIACLQEVDSKIFDLDLVPVLKASGYEGVFKKKGAAVAEGLAVFYNPSRYKKVDTYGIVLGEEINKQDIFKELWNKIDQNAPLVERILQRTTVAQAVLFECLNQEDCMLLVANTHLYFHPDADHIRLLQFSFALKWVHNILQKSKLKFTDKKIALIFCGDFNSTPECGIYKLMTTQNVPEDIPDWSSNAEEAVKGVSLSQDIKMESACGTPQYTNYTVGFADCLDYIFYQADAFDVEQVVPFPTLEELQANTALPSVVFPSDHISLAADLKWKNIV